MCIMEWTVLSLPCSPGAAAPSGTSLLALMAALGFASASPGITGSLLGEWKKDIAIFSRGPRALLLGQNGDCCI